MSLMIIKRIIVKSRDDYNNINDDNDELIYTEIPIAWPCSQVRLLAFLEEGQGRVGERSEHKFREKK